MATRPTTPATGGQRPLGPRSTKWEIDRLDGRERRFTYIAAAASMFFGIIIYVVDTGDRHYRPPKGRLSPETMLVLGIVFAALLVGSVLVGRRAPAGFMALFTFFAFDAYSFVVGLPFLLLAGWILYHSFKVQKEASAALKAGRVEAAESGGHQATATTRPSSRQPSRPSTRSSSKSPARPEANKRFTPKAAPPPAPKPSRREQRKATKASD
jgi:hypothetical protein